MMAPFLGRLLHFAVSDIQDRLAIGDGFNGDFPWEGVAVIHLGPVGEVLLILRSIGAIHEGEGIAGME